MGDFFAVVGFTLMGIGLLAFAYTSYQESTSCDPGYQRVIVEDVSACLEASDVCVRLT